MPLLREGCRLVRRLDRRKRPIWINEAPESDMKFLREYLTKDRYETAHGLRCAGLKVEGIARPPGRLGPGPGVVL